MVLNVYEKYGKTELERDYQETADLHTNENETCNIRDEHLTGG